MLTIPSVGKNEEQSEYSYAAGGKVEWYTCVRKQFGIFLKS